MYGTGAGGVFGTAWGVTAALAGSFWDLVDSGTSIRITQHYLLTQGARLKNRNPCASATIYEFEDVGNTCTKISEPTRPAAISRRAITVGLSRPASTYGAEPIANWRARAVAINVRSKRLGMYFLQSSTVVRAILDSGKLVFRVLRENRCAELQQQTAQTIKYGVLLCKISCRIKMSGLSAKDYLIQQATARAVLVAAPLSNGRLER